MHLNHKIFPCLIVTFFYLFFTSLFLYIFKADSYSFYLLIIECFISILIFIVSSKSELIFFKLICKILLSFILTFCLLAILLQLGSADREHAEIWLEAVRNKRPFGFFSFFVAEFYALFLLFAVYVASLKKYFYSFLIVLSVNGLCVSLIFSNQVLLSISFVLIVFPIFQKKRWQKFFIPFIMASIFATYFSLGEKDNKKSINPLPVGITRLMNFIVPNFPLLNNVSGYGNSINSSKPQSTPKISTKSIFSVQGSSFQTLYFTDNRLKKWDGISWSRFKNEDIKLKNPFLDFLLTKEKVKILFEPDSSLLEFQQITLTLEDYYFWIIPFMNNTFAVEFSKKLSDSSIEQIEDNCLSIVPSIKKGEKIILYNSSLETKNNDLEFSFIDTDSSYISPRVISLSKELGATEEIEKNNNLKKEYILNVINYLRDGFTYSLKSPLCPKDVDPYEYFLFTSKTGFCTWYAGAFTLLMQAANIPCRMVEGYRVSLDEKGRGKINGASAHAWAEVFIDNKWRTFEPTPVYNGEDPFSYINKNDKSTLKLVSSSLKNEIENQDKNILEIYFSAFFCKKFFIIILVLLFLLVLILTFIFIKNLSIENKARHVIRYYQKKGIISPDKTGWLLWKIAVEQNSKTPREKKYSSRALSVADEIMNKVYKNKK